MSSDLAREVWLGAMDAWGCPYCTAVPRWNGASSNAHHAAPIFEQHPIWGSRKPSIQLRSPRRPWRRHGQLRATEMNARAGRYFAGRAPEEGDGSDSDVKSSPVRARSDVARSAEAAPSRRRRIVARVVSDDVRGAAPAREPVGTFQPIAERARERGAVVQAERVRDVKEAGSDGVRTNVGAAVSSEDSSSESESESDSSRSDDKRTDQQDAYEDPFPSGFRPQFMKPAQKDTLQEQQIRAESEEKRFRRRRDEARQLVTDVLNEEDRQFDNNDKQLQLPDDTDYEHEHDVEFALWRVREVRRIKRDRETQKAWEQRTTKTAERKQQNEQTQPAGEQQPDPSSGPPKNSFMQRAYKLGPFFMEKDENGRFVQEIYNRDYSQPTEGENYDRTLLPKPLQVRHGQLGRSGRSKFTHLAAEDTAKDFIREVKRDPQLEKALNDQKPNR
ncbi:microfibrillar-associated protein [Gracilaria domingensis]|nr:microfibrillar-associated protein [Gracilaria domingensis]